MSKMLTDAEDIYTLTSRLDVLLFEREEAGDNDDLYKIDKEIRRILADLSIVTQDLKKQSNYARKVTEG